MSESTNVIKAFTADHAARLTGLSKAQLRYWENLGFFVPQYGAEDKGHAYGRIYSFEDLVGLRTIAILRNKYGVPFQRLRKIAEDLDSDYDQSVWSDRKVYLRGKTPVLSDGISDIASESDGQLVPVILLIDVVNDVAEKTRKLNERTADQHGQVERHRYVAHNSWVLSGTRIPTSAIKDFADAGYSIAEILKEYPALTPEDVRAALKHEQRLEKSA